MTALHGFRTGQATRVALIGTSVWSICSIAVAATWIVGMSFAAPLQDYQGNPPFGPAGMAALGWVVIGLSAVAACAVFSGFGVRSRLRPRPLMFGGLLAGIVVATFQVGLLPLGLVGAIASGELASPIGLGWQLITAVAVIGFGRLIRTEWRRLRNRCLHCGGRHRTPARPQPVDRPRIMASAATCVLAAILLAGVIPWAAVKIIWGFGGSALGITGEAWRQSQAAAAHSPLASWFAAAGLDITIVAAAVGILLAVLALARLPQWLPAGLVLVPAGIAALGLIGYGYPLLVAGLFGLVSDPVMLILGGLCFAGLGTALLIGFVSLLRRSTPTCPPGSYDPAPRVAVIGAGFAGLSAVKQLAKTGVDVTLIDQRTYSTFQPLLYQVATGGLNAGDITYPIRNFLARRRTVRFVCDRVSDIDHDRSVIRTAAGQQIEYDYVIIANGATTNYFGTPGAEEHSVGIYTRPDALRVRDRLFGLLEDAANSPASEPINVVVVGGGATGIEMAGNLAELRRHGLPNSYPELDPDQVKIILVEAGPQLLAPFAPSLQRYSLQQLRRRGVDVRLESPITAVEEDAVRFADGSVQPASLVLWTAGVRGSDEAAGWRLDTNRVGRILVDRSLQVSGKPEVFAVGDAAVIGANPLPQLAQPALQSGKHAARQIARLERDQPLRPFHYFDKGIMATIGERSAVVEVPFGLTISGILAWFTWLGIHIIYLLGGRNRFVTATNLAFRYLRPGSFGVIVGDPVRATPEASARQPQPVGRG